MAQVCALELGFEFIAAFAFSLLEGTLEAMAVSFPRLRARIGCCRLALDDCSGEGKEFVSATQFKVLQDMLTGAKLTDEERASLVVDLSSIKFSDDHSLALLELAAGKKTSYSQLEAIAGLPALSDIHA